MVHRPGGGVPPRECPRVTRGGLTIETMNEKWMKTSWNKGEWREEVKLVAKVSGLSFDGAKIVVRNAVSEEKHREATSMD